MVNEIKENYLYKLSDITAEGFLGLKSTMTILRMIHRGDLQAVNISKNRKYNLYRIEGREIKRFIEAGKTK
jgi:hypothetical protein